MFYYFKNPILYKTMTYETSIDENVSSVIEICMLITCGLIHIGVMEIMYRKQNGSDVCVCKLILCFDSLLIISISLCSYFCAYIHLN